MSEYEGAGFDYDDDEDLYVNFTEKEIASESRDFEPLPTGKYLMAITECALRESRSVDNPGKPMYAIEFTVLADVTGSFIGRKAWTNACLFTPALYTIVQIMKALDMEVAPLMMDGGTRMRIPSANKLMGQTLVVGGRLKGETKDKRDPSKVYQPRFEPVFFGHQDTWARIVGGKATIKGTTSQKPSSTPSLIS